MIIERARALRKQIEILAETLDDSIALENLELFPNWSEKVDYTVDTRVRYKNILYKCLQAHTSQPTWEPDVAVSLWAKVLIPDPTVIPDWIQPDSTNPYMKGDKVKHNDNVWISIVDYNVWEPGVYGWELEE